MNGDNDDGTGDGPWWEHAVNALAAGFDAYTQRKNAALARREAELDQRRRQRMKVRSFGESGPPEPRQRVRKMKTETEPKKPCCTGPARE